MPFAKLLFFLNHLIVFHYGLLALPSDSTNHKTNCTEVVNYENWPGGGVDSGGGAERCAVQGIWIILSPWIHEDSHGAAHAKRYFTRFAGERRREDGASRSSSPGEPLEEIPRFCFRLLPSNFTPPLPLPEFKQFASDICDITTGWQNICQLLCYWLALLSISLGLLASSS